MKNGKNDRENEIEFRVRFDRYGDQKGRIVNELVVVQGKLPESVCRFAASINVQMMSPNGPMASGMVEIPLEGANSLEAAFAMFDKAVADWKEVQQRRIVLPSAPGGNVFRKN